MIIPKGLGSSVGAVRIFVAQLLLVVTLFQGAWAAPVITPQVALGFGEIALRSNNAIISMAVSNSGAVTPGNSQIIPLGGAVRGEYRLTGFPPNTVLSFEWDDAQLSYAGQMHPEFLTVTAYTPTAATTNGAGEAVVYLGATIKTSGTGAMYNDGTYSAVTAMRVTYWSESFGQFITHSDAVIFQAVLQSTISVTQQQGLSFGYVAANSDPALTATLRIRPNGTTSEIPAGSARIRHLGGAVPAIMQISGAAPNTQISITPDPGSVLLIHIAQGTGVPQFVVRSLEADPSPTGITDSNGALLVKVGAVLETQATTSAYVAGSYSGVHSITISY